MKHYALLSFLMFCTLLVCESSFAQKSIYFIDYAEIPPEIGYRTGYIVTLKSDTIYGKLRNTESLGSILTPRVIQSRYLNIELKYGGNIPKIAFIPELTPKSEQQKYKPDEIKAFGYLSSYNEQQPIELQSSYGKSGFITKSALKRALSLHDPYEDIHLLQRNIYDGMASFESKYIENLNETCFLQRQAEGKMTLYYDTRHNEYYITKAGRPEQLLWVNYNNPDFIYNAFGDSKKIAVVIKEASEMKRAENFTSLLGIYNLEAEGNLEALTTDYLVTNKGDTLKGALQIKGLSNLMLGTLKKVSIIPVGGQKVEMHGDEIKRIVKYINNTPIVFDAYTGSNSKRYFHQLKVDGTMKLYYDPRSTEYYNQTMGDTYHTFGSYIIVKNEQPVTISKGNFEEQYTKLFTESENWGSYLKIHPEIKQYDNLPQLVSLYNKSGN